MSVTLLRGRIGSGKTYFARQLCAESGARLLRTDDFTKDMFKGACPGRAKRAEAEAKLRSSFLELAVLNEKCGISTVIDDGFWSKSELRRATEYLEAHSVDYKVVTLTADFDTRLSRVKNRTDGAAFTQEKLTELDMYFEE